jgi:tRNA (guanine-N7-)-methyltransferase
MAAFHGSGPISWISCDRRSPDGVVALAGPPIGQVYGRRRARPLRGRKAEAIDVGLEVFAIGLPGPPDLLEPRALFKPQPAAIWLEIGFGGGEHLAAQAASNPEVGFIGCEPFINGVSNLVVLLDEAGAENVRVFSDDARLLLNALPEGSIDRAFLLFPDPWPKRRHIERRFANPGGLDLIARALADDAEFRVATDHAELAAWMPARIGAHPAFRLESRSDVRPADWAPTRYEAKALAAGRRPAYLSYRRVCRKIGEDRSL